MSALGLQLRRLLAERSRIASKIEATHVKAAELRLRSAEDEAEAAELERAVIERQAEALAAGRDGAEADGGKPLRLRQRGRAGERAAELASADLPALEERFKAAELAVTDAALTTFRADRDAAAEAVTGALAGIVPALAQLMAADRVRRALIGDRFAFDATRHAPGELWSAEIVARAFAAAIPARLRPDGLAENIERQADTLAAEALAALKEDAK